jgi:hypothetical protein
MKKWTLFLLVISVRCQAATIVFDFFGQTPSTLNDDLIAYWQLGEASGTRADVEPTGTTQNLTDNNTVGQVAGIIGNAAFFVAADSRYLSHVDSADLSTGNIDFTIAGWFKATSLDVDSTLASQWLATGNQRSWRLWFHSAIGKMEFEVSDDGVTASAAVASSFGLPSTNVWHFIAGWHDSVNNTINISINNGLPTTLSYALGTFDSTGTFDLGARGAGTNPWDGALDAFGFWKKVLTGSELTELYNLGNGKQCCPFDPP